jgi:hypothetical protein
MYEHIHNGILFSFKKKKMLSFVTIWMYLRNIVLNEIRLTQKDKCLDYEHMIKARAHKGGVRIGKTPKKLASIYCSQCRETKAETLKATETNRKRGTGTREKVRSKRINLEGNTHVQEINVSQCPV